MNKSRKRARKNDRRNAELNRALRDIWPDDPKGRALARRIVLKNADPEYRFRQGVKSMTKKFGREDPATLRTWKELIAALEQKRKYVEAEIEYRQLIPLEEKVLGLQHSDTFESWSGLAFVLARQRRYSEAEWWARRTVECARKELDPKSFWVRRYETFLRRVRRRRAGLSVRIERA